MTRRWLVTGHPKTGTHYAQKCLCEKGYRVSHERYPDEDGVVNWMWGTRSSQPSPWGPGYDGTEFENRVVILRRPIDALSSIAQREQGSEEWRKQFVFIPDGCDEYERSVWSYAGWIRMCMLWEPTAVVKSEHFDEWLGISIPQHKRGSLPITEDWLLTRLSEFGKQQYQYLKETYKKAEVRRELCRI